jgi:hypothetical protein
LAAARITDERARPADRLRGDALRPADHRAQYAIIGAGLPDPQETSRSSLSVAGPAGHMALRAISPSSHVTVQS